MSHAQLLGARVPFPEALGKGPRSACLPHAAIGASDRNTQARAREGGPLLSVLWVTEVTPAEGGELVVLNSNQVRDAPCGKPFSELHPLIISPFENLSLEARMDSGSGRRPAAGS